MQDISCWLTASRSLLVGFLSPQLSRGPLGVNMTRAQARGLVSRLKSALSIPRSEFADLYPIIIAELRCFQNLKPSYTQVLFVTNYLSCVSLQRSKNPCLTTSRTHTTLRTMPCVSYLPLPLAAAAATLLQSCPTLCDPTDGSPPGSSVPGILQARTLEWAAISFSPPPLTVPVKCSLSPWIPTLHLGSATVKTLSRCPACFYGSSSTS